MQKTAPSHFDEATLKRELHRFWHHAPRLAITVALAASGVVSCGGSERGARDNTASVSQAATVPAELPLFQVAHLQYKGAFRLPAETFGASSTNYAQGPIAYNPDNHSLFVVGHAHDQAIAEFAIPELVGSTHDRRPQYGGGAAPIIYHGFGSCEVR